MMLDAYAGTTYQLPGSCQRHNLENLKKRLKALELKVATEGIQLNDQQIAALERKHEDDVACGEIETHHPGYLARKIRSILN